MRRKRLIPAIAAVTLAVTATVALAASHHTLLRVRKNVHVTNAQFASSAVKPVNKQAAIAVGPAGFPVYTFQGETTHHIICKKTDNPNTNCWAFWPPVSANSASGLAKQTGIRGHLATFRNHGVRQLTLNGQPLYYFTPDIQSGNKHEAQGDELHTFGSIWHLVLAHVAGASGQNAAAPTGTSTAGGGGGYGPGW